MKTTIRTTTTLALLALASGCSLAALALVPAAQAALSPGAYAVRSLCSAPSPAHAGCLGLRLVARAGLTATSSHQLATGAQGAAAAGATPALEQKEPLTGSLTPGNVLSAYALSGIAAPASRQTIGIVDAYNDPAAAADLEHFDARLKLAPCSELEGCFRKVNEQGNASPAPPTNAGWAQEIATDVEVAHGICPSCRILLVEASSNSFSDLFAAEETAVRLGASEISNSWGGGEPSLESPAFNHPGIVITASSGDNGYLNWGAEPEEQGSVDYPASSPHVVAVGGTRLTLNSPAGTWKSEAVWNGRGAGGGGCSSIFTAPPWQRSVSDWPAVECGEQRAVADVAADADPYTGVAVYDSTENEGAKGWAVVGGTSVASPIIASAFALAGGAGGVEYPARTLYENALKTPASLHDVNLGSNGECGFYDAEGLSTCSLAEESASCEGHLICVAAPGYDGPSGVGTPNGIGAFQTTSQALTREASPAQSPQQLAPSSTVAAPAATPSSVVHPPPVPTLSALALTRSAIVALNRVRPRVLQVSFAFTLNVGARVRVTLARRVRVHGRTLWRTVSPALLISAPAGRASRHLAGRAPLGHGRYQLTLTASGGNAASIVFQIG
jgi:hypothetical protein